MGFLRAADAPTRHSMLFAYADEREVGEKPQEGHGLMSRLGPHQRSSAVAPYLHAYGEN